MPPIFGRQLHTSLRCSKNAVTCLPIRLRPHLSLSLCLLFGPTSPSIRLLVVRPRPPPRTHRALADKRFSSFQNVATSGRNVRSSSGGPETSSPLKCRIKRNFCLFAPWLVFQAWPASLPPSLASVDVPVGDSLKEEKEGEREDSYCIPSNFI